MLLARDILLNGLRQMRFYENNFGSPLDAVFGDTADDGAITFLDDLFPHIPKNKAEGAARGALKHIVSTFEHCPSPKDVREALAVALIENEGLSMDALYEKAKTFISRPPEVAAEAGTWVNRIIYTAITRLGRERFALINREAWLFEIADTIFTVSELSTYQPVKTEVPQVVARKYTGLLKRDD